jgi:cohesin complex subunit SA-1/2
VLETTEPEDAQVLGEDKEGAEDLGGEGEEYRAPKPKTTPRKAKSKMGAKAKGPPPTKKPRVAKVTGTKPAKTTVRRARKPKEGDDAYDAAQVAKDTKIAADNPLFSTFLVTFPFKFLTFILIKTL